MRPTVKGIYLNDTDRDERPNIDEIVMIKTLILQSMWGCSDDSMEKEMCNRIDFVNFLQCLETIPDTNAIWLFGYRLSSTRKDRIIWNVIWKQLEDHGISIQKGMVEDATFIKTDP